jgi:hypothetical protein
VGYGKKGKKVAHGLFVFHNDHSLPKMLIFRALWSQPTLSGLEFYF